MRHRRILLSVLVAVAALELTVNAAWDKSKPATNSALSSLEIRSNWAAIERTIGLNLMRDPAQAVWGSGTTSAPTLYTLAGAGAAIVRTGTGEADTTRQVGKYASKVTFGSATASLCQDVYSTTDFDTGLRSRIVSLGWWTKTSTASQVRVEIQDGIGSTFSGYHTGSGAFQWLTATRTIDAAATKITACFRVESAGAAYASAGTLQLGEVPPDDFRPPLSAFYDLNTGALRFNFAPEFFPGTSNAGAIRPVGRDFTDPAQHANSGTGETDLTSWPVGARALSFDGAVYRLTCYGSFSGSGNSRTLRAKFGATSLTAVAGVYSGGQWKLVAEIIRTGAATQKMTVHTSTSVNASINVVNGTPAETLSGAVTLKTTGQGGASSDIVQEACFGEIAG